jgi:Ankyrin repeats (3 copies)
MGEVQLIEAVKAGDLATVEALLASGADIHQQDKQGWTPLNWAAGKVDVAIVESLLKHGADIFTVGRDQRTPYMIALAAARVEVARLLREAEEKAGRAKNYSQQPRKYCKAYYLKDLRAFSGWSESQTEDGDVHTVSDNDVVFLHQDLTVTTSMWHNENVLFNQRTPEWEDFCTAVLQFKVPDDFDLIPQAPHAGGSG